MAKLESSVEARLKGRVEGIGHGVRCWKLVCPGISGVPDRMILCPGGVVVFVETKRPGEKERARQVWVQGKLRELGFHVFSAVDSPEKIEAVVDYCREVLECRK